MKETRVYCDACGTEITDKYPGETYTAVPVMEAVRRHHEPSDQERQYYHLCADHVEPHDFRSSHLFRAGSTVPMMLYARMGYEYVARENFTEPYEEIAAILERVWAGE